MLSPVVHLGLVITTIQSLFKSRLRGHLGAIPGFQALCFGFELGLGMGKAGVTRLYWCMFRGL